MKKWVALLVIIGVGYPQLASALCSEPQPRSVCAEYSASKLVVEATLLKVHSLHDKDDPEGIVARSYTLKVERVLRGAAQRTIDVYEENASGRASFDWKIGTRYLLFLFDSSEGKGLSLDGCGNSSSIASANSAFHQIDQLRNQGQIAWILGTVSTRYHAAPMADVEVIARYRGSIYKTSTDQNGTFRIKVMPGHYTVEPVQSHLSFEVDEMSYENPRHLTMQPGTCAQVQFIATSDR
jgi:hypothetical protein